MENKYKNGRAILLQCIGGSFCLAGTFLRSPIDSIFAEIYRLHTNLYENGVFSDVNSSSFSFCPHMPFAAMRLGESVFLVALTFVLPISVGKILSSFYVRENDRERVE